MTRLTMFVLLMLLATPPTIATVQELEAMMEKIEAVTVELRDKVEVSMTYLQACCISSLLNLC